MNKMMKTAVAAAICAAVPFAHALGDSVMASQNWVRRYVSAYVPNAISNSVPSLAQNAVTTASNGFTTVSVGSGATAVSFTYEDATAYALVVTNATAEAVSAGVTNGLLFVWNDDGTFISNSGNFVQSHTNQSCLSWGGIDSVVTNGLDTFTNRFAVSGMMIQPKAALAATNGWSGASVSLLGRAIDAMLSLVCGSAYAAAPGNLPASAIDWETPKNWNVASLDGEIYYNEGGETKTIKCRLNEDGDFIFTKEQQGYIDSDYALKTAVNALHIALVAEAKAHTIAEKLAALDWSEKDTKVEDSSTGATSSGKTRNGNALTISAPNIIAKADGRSIDKGDGSVFSLHGFNSSAEALLPTYNNGYLGWYAIGKWGDGKGIQEVTADGSYPDRIKLNGWPTEDGCNARLSTMLTEDADAQNRENHFFLCQYGKGDSATLHYVPVGGVIRPQVTVDGNTISTNETGHVGEIAVAGAYYDGNAGRYLRCKADGSGGTEWAVAGGGALKLVGTDGEVVVGSGSATNTITFASEADSNVKVTVTGNGSSATVKIGVYYR